MLPQVLASQPAEETPNSQVGDIEDFGAVKIPQPLVPIANKRKRIPAAEESQQLSQDLELSQSWREILGPPPPLGTTKVGEADCAEDAPGLYSSIQAAWVLLGASCVFPKTLCTHMAQGYKEKYNQQTKMQPLVGKRVWWLHSWGRNMMLDWSLEG